ncbi:hypothetical protein EJ03DRAFT_219758 [Teratosphaeria nubilosa]|uniref:Secreted protein n=1 Tax=Teratosphaeria nubilosa TaxID=161662 RepID=A0A6G1KWW4_9PEZI|nr:hypothetical protein EJ03DRAFT_219758 [Teratosphaeria nubilosa]
MILRFFVLPNLVLGVAGVAQSVERVALSQTRRIDTSRSRVRAPPSASPILLGRSIQRHNNQDSLQLPFCFLRPLFFCGSRKAMLVAE